MCMIGPQGDLRQSSRLELTRSSAEEVGSPARPGACNTPPVHRIAQFTLLLIGGAVTCAAAAAVGFGAAAPNGESAKPPAQILADSVKAVNGATSLRLVASGTSGGSPIALNLKLVSGRGGEGSVTENGLTFQIIRVGAKAYFEAGSAFWKKFAGTIGPQLFDGRWIEASATSGQLASFTPLTSLRSFVDGVLASHGTLKLGTPATIDGRPAIALVDTTQGGTLYVAATGTPYPLEISSKGSGTIRFEAWNGPVSLSAPKNPVNFTGQLK
jgi:hypothetical protein